MLPSSTNTTASPAKLHAGREGAKAFGALLMPDGCKARIIAGHSGLAPPAQGDLPAAHAQGVGPADAPPENGAAEEDLSASALFRTPPRERPAHLYKPADERQEKEAEVEDRSPHFAKHRSWRPDLDILPLKAALSVPNVADNPARSEMKEALTLLPTTSIPVSEREPLLQRTSTAAPPQRAAAASLAAPAIDWEPAEEPGTERILQRSRWAVGGGVERMDARPQPVGGLREQVHHPLRERHDQGPRGGSPVTSAVRVIEAQSFPAPGQAGVTATAAPLINAIASSADWTSLAYRPTSVPAQAHVQGSPVRTLTIQLHPAELGMVTAKLRYSGEQLSIELQSDKAEACQRLAADGEAILKAVRALGIEVDRVTVHQQPQWQGGRADAVTTEGGTHRDSNSSASGGTSEHGGQPEGRLRQGRGENEAESSAPGTTQAGQARTGHGVYI
jgi:hypothetical protein